MTKDLKFIFQSKQQTHDSQYQDIWRHHFTMPDGKPKSFEIHEIGETSVILPLTADNQVVCVSQYRPGPDMVLTELPAGFVDIGETPLQAAKRELLEETGYTGEFEYIATALVDAYSTAVHHVFIARNCHKIQPQNLDSTEFIEVKLLQLETFQQICYSGNITHGSAAMIALCKLNQTN